MITRTALVRWAWLWLGLGLATVVSAQPRLAKYEPAVGCYIGAFIENDPVCSNGGVGNIAQFEKLVGKEHACYVTYVGYGRPFPASFAHRLKRHGAAAHIGWEPNNGLQEVQDNAYLHEWAQAARKSGIPIFLRFASEMNDRGSRYGGNPSLFIEKWRLVARVMRDEAPNVAMVWCVVPYEPMGMSWYYPGDDFVDWVGINLYSLLYHNNSLRWPAADEDPRDSIRYLYSLFAHRKPIMVCEYAATSYCQLIRSPAVGFALSKMTLLYGTLARDFPRVKAIQWFSLDARGLRNAGNNYSLTWNNELVERYGSLISGSYWLSHVVNGPELLGGPSEPGPPEPVIPSPVRPTVPLTASATLAHTGRPAASPPALVEPAGDPRSEEPSAEAGGPTECSLMGLHDGQVVRGAVELTPRLPAGCRPRYVAYRLDGRPLGISNQSPFTVSWNSDLVQPGRYRLTCHVYLSDGSEPMVSAPLDIEVRREP